MLLWIFLIMADISHRKINMCTINNIVVLYVWCLRYLKYKIYIVWQIIYTYLTEADHLIRGAFCIEREACSKLGKDPFEFGHIQCIMFERGSVDQKIIYIIIWSRDSVLTSLINRNWPVIYEHLWATTCISFYRCFSWCWIKEKVA